jgi:hypothetical protein
MLVWKVPNILQFSVGLSDVPGEAMVKSYCPKCMDVYTPNHQDTTTQMGHTLAQVSPTCFSWYTQNIGQNAQQISLFLGN